jgi:hypothetical protein
MFEEDSKMSYPPAPWKARGYVMQSLKLIDVEKARGFVPPELEIVSVLPSKTLGAVYFAEYGPGSALDFNELIISSALTRRGSTIRFWISHIYVDNADSMAGGREIWGLPKEMAQFTWNDDHTQVEARQDGRLLCAMRSGSPTWLIPIIVLLPTFSILGASLLSFLATVTGRLGLSGYELDISADSPFTGLNLTAKGLALSIRNARLVAGAPGVVTSLAPTRTNES